MSRRTLGFTHLLTGLVALTSAPADGAAQSIRGIVSERDTYVPIELATVTLLTERLDTLAQVVTTDEGFFTFDLNFSKLWDVGPGRLRFRWDIFMSVSIPGAAVCSSV